MNKWRAYFKQNSNSAPQEIGTYQSAERAAEACDKKLCGERDHECIKSLLERHFYMVGYGPTMFFIEEVK